MKSAKHPVSFNMSISSLTPHHLPSGRELSNAQLPWIKPYEIFFGVLVHGKEAVIPPEAFLVFHQGLSQIFRSVVVVVQVDLHLPETCAAKPCKFLHIVLPVLLLRIKEAVFQGIPVIVLVFLRAFWVFAHPSLDPPPGNCRRRLVPVRFEVIADAEEKVGYGNIR